MSAKSNLGSLSLNQYFQILLMHFIQTVEADRRFVLMFGLIVNLVQNRFTYQAGIFCDQESLASCKSVFSSFLKIISVCKNSRD